jgi:Lrp/AsnC family transcriptional regulator, leucine-responsive regulatory protein
MQSLDRFDRAILTELLDNGRATQAELGERAHLSGTAAARRQRLLEERGLVTGYHAAIDAQALGFGMTVQVLITLERQSDGAMSAFEEAVQGCPSVTGCHLLSGGEDYLITLWARDLADFERIHRTELSALPGVARMRSLFSLRAVVQRRVPPSLFR